MKPGVKNPLKRVLNLVLYLSFCTVIGTGLLLAYRLPPGSKGGHGLTVLGMTRHEWGDWHFYIGLLMVAVGFTHLLLNWAWVRRIASKSRLWLALGGLAAGLVLIATPVLLPVEATVADTHEEHGDGYSGSGQQGGGGRGWRGGRGAPE